jgi:hypothetical protein
MRDKKGNGGPYLSWGNVALRIIPPVGFHERFFSMPTKMIRRPEFCRDTRSFSMTAGLREGYDGNKLHSESEVVALVKSFAIDHDLEFGGEIIPTTVVYSYRSDGKMVVQEEPGAKISGLFPPNKFGEKSDEELVDMIELLASYLAGPLGQTSFHAEVCGVHYSWKRAGQLTAHEAAKQAASAEPLPHVTREELMDQLRQWNLSNSPIINPALNLIEVYHGPQTRIGGGSMLEQHVYPVASRVLNYLGERITGEDLTALAVAAALCHDLIEDTSVTYRVIRDGIGSLVADLVYILTDVNKRPENYFRGISRNELASIIKVMDRLNNLLCAHLIPDKGEIARYCDETEEFVIPLAKSHCAEFVTQLTDKVAELRTFAAT